MAASTFVKNFTHASLVLADGAGSPLTCTMVGEMGDFNVTGLADVLNEISVYESRGKFDSAAYGARRYPGYSFSFKVKELTDAAANPADFIMKNGFASAATSVLGTGTGTVWSFNMSYAIEGTNFGDSADHSVVMTKCIVDSFDLAEGDPSTFSISGRILGAITGDLACAEIP